MSFKNSPIETPAALAAISSALAVCSSIWIDTISRPCLLNVIYILPLDIHFAKLLYTSAVFDGLIQQFPTFEGVALVLAPVRSQGIVCHLATACSDLNEAIDELTTKAHFLRSLGLEDIHCLGRCAEV